MRKVFISYYHNDDQAYKNWFVQNFGNLFINKSVEFGDINTDVSTDYIKHLIQSDDFLADASVLIVLCGLNTWGRKHVDWEIAGALSSKVGGCSGVMGILLPSYQLLPNGNYQYENVPPRLADNIKTGYAEMHLWNTVCASFQSITNAIESVFNKRTQTNLITNSRLQMQRNTSGVI
ncbi:TIR domain-containing protein [Candidatus Peregrinibacteria bacterium]|nr:TIR domain-containing protein [Candidatus Peregrinibacteria bacterium]